MGRSERAKGHRFEREIAKDFQDAGYPNACRQLEYQENTAFGVDLDNTGVYLVQCKSRKTYVSVATIKEIREEDYQQWRGTAETVPILVTKADRQPVRAVLPWKKLQALIGLERSTDGEQRKAGPADG